ncbi:MAG: DUF4177 domain-containing protein [Pseudomonadota bacterium]|jgi:hypothetical protein|nr:DUF4177 domain-containing protein [Pseudomonadota bacterium]
MNAATRWEYKTILYDTVAFLSGKIDVVGLEKVLNDSGREGWELVNMAPHISRLGKGGGLVLVLKRSR